MEDLLFLAQRIPYPPTKGDKIRSWHILQYLARHYRVHLGCFIDDPYDTQFVPLLANLCASIHCEPLTPALAKVRSLAAIARGEPMTLRYFESRRLRHWVNAAVREHAIKRVFVFCSAMAPYVAELIEATRVLDMVDIDSQKWLQYARSSNPLARLLYAREGGTLFSFERRIAALFHQTLLASPAEADLFRHLAPETTGRVLSVMNGVDLDYFSPARAYPNPFRSSGAKIVFTGAMDYRPNVEAVRWFVDAVMPELGHIGDDLEFWIVGANPIPSIQRLARRNGVRVTGRVNDVRPYLAHASAVVAPLLIAPGVQNKVLEAMAMAKPVVITPQAKEGINAVAGEEVLVAGDSRAFAAQLGTALSHLGAKIGDRARRRIEADFAWTHSLETIRLLLEKRGEQVSATNASARQIRR
jgi:sugar transferase (PEP-CTERM/EpsH1 system associated)